MAGGGVVFRRNSCSGVAGMKQIEIVGGGLAGLALGIAMRRREVPLLRIPRWIDSVDSLPGPAQAQAQAQAN